MTSIKTNQLFRVRKTKSKSFFTRKELEVSVEKWNLLAQNSDQLIFLCKKGSCRNLRFLNRFQASFKTPHTKCKDVARIKTITERSLVYRLKKNPKALLDEVGTNNIQHIFCSDDDNFDPFVKKDYHIVNSNNNNDIFDGIVDFSAFKNDDDCTAKALLDEVGTNNIQHNLCNDDDYKVSLFVEKDDSNVNCNNNNDNGDGVAYFSAFKNGDNDVNSNNNNDNGDDDYNDMFLPDNNIYDNNESTNTTTTSNDKTSLFFVPLLVIFTIFIFEKIDGINKHMPTDTSIDKRRYLKNSNGNISKPLYTNSKSQIRIPTVVISTILFAGESYFGVICFISIIWCTYF